MVDKISPEVSLGRSRQAPGGHPGGAGKPREAPGRSREASGEVPGVPGELPGGLQGPSGCSGGLWGGPGGSRESPREFSRGRLGVPGDPIAEKIKKYTSWELLLVVVWKAGIMFLLKRDSQNQMSAL